MWSLYNRLVKIIHTGVLVVIPNTVLRYLTHHSGGLVMVNM